MHSAQMLHTLFTGLSAKEFAALYPALVDLQDLCVTWAIRRRLRSGESK